MESASTVAESQEGKDRTSRRLVDAAAQVFARDGVRGATTREIASEAGVSEMTLFRHFGTKENLLGSVIKQAFSQPRTSRQPEIPVDQEGLRTALISLAKAHSRFLAENFAFIRVVIGELHHYTKQERDVVKRIFGPMRQQLIELLQEAAQRNLVVAGDIGMIADLFEGMLFMDVLRRQYHERQTYSADRYFNAAVDMILKQVQVNGSRAPSNTRAKSRLRSTSLGIRRDGRTANAHRNNGRSDRR